MGDVVTFGGETKAPHNPDDILEKAKGRGIERVLVVGMKLDGSLWFSGSHSEKAENFFMLAQAQKFLID